VQEVARAKWQEQFTSLAHYLTVEALRRAYQLLDGKAAAGADGVTKAAYGKNLEQNLVRLHGCLKAGQYRAKPVRRVWIEKPEGGKRPLGIPCIEDKIVQGAVVEILNSIYEEDFHGFSYGFRPGRDAHQALQALQTVLQKGKVNWVLDMDISKFFDTIRHRELLSMVRRRVMDRSILRLMSKWLTVGVVEEDGRVIRSKEGTPQGGVISPLLANVFLHYVTDEYVHVWRKTKAQGEVYIVRYADDFVIACEHLRDAKMLRETLGKRLQTHGLKVNKSKTKLLRFGKGSGGGKWSETFDFLGFTHIAGRSRAGWYLVRRKTARKRFARSLKVIAQWCKENRHAPLQWQWHMLKIKLQGHYNYYGVRGNFDALQRFRHEIWKQWIGALRRRSQKSNLGRLCGLLKNVFPLPMPVITHPENWLAVNPGYLLGRAGCGNSARPDL
jgi:group II intron reverse transcriptase/maturase